MSGIYIHIPFCHGKCHYCDFFSTPVRSDYKKYVKALEREFNSRKNEIFMPPSTIYLGGGTPSILPPAQLRDILGFLPLEKAEEITIEVNPEDVTESFAEFLSTTPVNRVSMGVQSMNDSELKSIGRRHSSADTIRAIELLRHAGIRNLSLDLIFGLPGQTCESWQNSLEKILSFNPEHLSAYSLMYEPGTRLWAMRQAGKIEEISDNLAEAMYFSLCRKTSEAGMQHYEISNFCRPGYHSRHNSSYWNLTPYLGLGVSAHSFDGKTRRYNPSDIQGYIESASPTYMEEVISNDERIDEYIMIRMRTVEGLDIDKFTSLFGEKNAEAILYRAQTHLSTGHLTKTGNRLQIPERFWLTSDAIIIDLFQS